MSNVWVVRDWQFDTTAAGAHGSVMEPIFKPQVSPHDVRGQEAIIRRDVLEFSQPDDFVLTCGPQVMVATLAALLMERHGRVNFLLWDRWQSRYTPKTVGKRTY